MTYESSPRDRSEADPARPCTSGDTDSYDEVQLIAVGPPRAVEFCRLHLHHLGFAEANDWSQPMPGIGPEAIRIPDPNKVMRVLTKRVPR